MLSDKILRNCLVVSIILHMGILIVPKSHKALLNIKPQEQLEVVYRKKIIDINSNKKKILPRALVSKNEKIADSISKRDPSKSKLNTNAQKKKWQNSRLNPITKKIQQAFSMPASEKMLIFNDSKDLSGKPSYLKYYNIIRSKIKKMAYVNKPYIFKSGEVDLVFTVLDTGDLKNVTLAKANHPIDPGVTQCALDSVYAASPFPPFTNDMKEDYLTLQVAISFEK